MRTSPTWARSTATGCRGCAARAPRWSWSRCRQQSAGPSTGRPQTAPAGRSCSTAAAPGWTGPRPPAGCSTSPRPLASRSPGHIRICCATPMSRPCLMLALTCATCRSPHGTPTRAHDAVRPGPAEPGPPPELHPGRLHGLRHLTQPRLLRPRPQDARHCRCARVAPPVYLCADLYITSGRRARQFSLVIRIAVAPNIS